MRSSATKSPYAGYRFPAEVISQAVWLYFRFPLSLRMVEEMLAARGIDVSHETVRLHISAQTACDFGLIRPPVSEQFATDFGDFATPVSLPSATAVG